MNLLTKIGILLLYFSGAVVVYHIAAGIVHTLSVIIFLLATILIPEHKLDKMKWFAIVDKMVDDSIISVHNHNDNETKNNIR